MVGYKVAALSLVAIALPSAAGAGTAETSQKLVISMPNLAAAANPAFPATEKRKMICRTDYQIGSLVKKTRRCGDAGMWARANRANRDMTETLQQSGLIQQAEGLDPDRAGPAITQGYSPR